MNRTGDAKNRRKETLRKTVEMHEYISTAHCFKSDRTTSFSLDRTDLTSHLSPRELESIQPGGTAFDDVEVKAVRLYVTGVAINGVLPQVPG